MHFKIDELKRILNWFDISEGSLIDEDLKLYDKIKDYINDSDVENLDEKKYFSPRGGVDSEDENLDEYDENYDDEEY